MNDQDFLRAQTPFYAFDLSLLRGRMTRIRRALGPDVRLVYAAKANAFLLKALLPLADGFELCSPGEARLARQAGVPGEKVVLSGVNKKKEDIEETLEWAGDDAVYTAESLRQMELLEQAAHERHLLLQVLLRISSGNQFGMDEETIERIIAMRRTFPHLRIRGLQYFSGTQKKLKKIEEELKRIDSFIGRLQRNWQFVPDELEYGPGLYVPYFEGEDDGQMEEELLFLRTQLETMHFQGIVTLEMGRYIAADCGYYVTQVADLKKNGPARYAIVDGGIHQLNYYGQMMAMKKPHIRKLSGTRGEGGGRPSEAAEKTVNVSAAAKEAADVSDAPEGAVYVSAAPSRNTAGEVKHWTICGSLCTTADILVRDCPLGELQIGDRLVFERTGAYSVTEGISLFLTRDLPAVYLFEEGKLQPVRSSIPTDRLFT